MRHRRWWRAIPRSARALPRAARDEEDHLAWTQTRLAELDDRTSLLNPLWYAGSFAIGTVAGLAGDRVNLGFVVETERQVEAHLTTHLDRLPEQRRQEPRDRRHDARRRGSPRRDGAGGRRGAVAAAGARPDARRRRRDEGGRLPDLTSSGQDRPARACRLRRPRDDVRRQARNARRRAARTAPRDRVAARAHPPSCPPGAAPPRRHRPPATTRSASRRPSPARSDLRFRAGVARATASIAHASSSDVEALRPAQRIDRPAADRATPRACSALGAIDASRASAPVSDAPHHGTRPARAGAPPAQRGAYVALALRRDAGRGAAPSMQRSCASSANRVWQPKSAPGRTSRAPARRARRRRRRG